jgi:hypothetical protein
LTPGLGLSDRSLSAYIASRSFLRSLGIAETHLYQAFQLRIPTSAFRILL